MLPNWYSLFLYANANKNTATIATTATMAKAPIFNKEEIMLLLKNYFLVDFLKTAARALK